MKSLSDFRKWLKLNKQEMEVCSLAIGINSTVDLTKDLHIVMLDYDLQDIKLVDESVKELQEFWKLGDAHIIKTNHGFHAYFFSSIVPYGRLKLIIEYARYVDPMYKYISRYYDHKTIRAAGKYTFHDLKYVKLLKGNASEKYSELTKLKMNEFEQLSGVKLGR